MTAPEALAAFERELAPLLVADSRMGVALRHPVDELRSQLAAGAAAASLRPLLDEIEDILESCCAARAWRDVLKPR